MSQIWQKIEAMGSYIFTFVQFFERDFGQEKKGEVPPPLLVSPIAKSLANI